MDFKTRLEAKVAAAQAVAIERTNASLDRLLDNDSYIETQRSLMAKDKEIKQLDAIMTQLNSIMPYSAKNGDKFSVKVFPVNHFNTGLDRVIGIITGSRSAFVDDLAIQYEAITGISMIELELARTALGQPAYFSKGEVFEEVRGDINEFNNLLTSIAIKLGINEFTTKISKEALDLWFVRSKLAAERKKLEFDKAVVMNGITSFTIED